MDFFVSNPGCTNHYLGEYDETIQKFLTEHYACDLTMGHDDDDLDKLWEEGYVADYQHNPTIYIRCK